MRILIDITHPAHLHFFKNAIARLSERGHEIKLTGRDKDILRHLAAELVFDVEFFGGAPSSALGMARTLTYRKRRLSRIIDAFQPDVLAAVGGTFIGFLGWVRKIPNIVFYDTEDATISNRITYPFASRICTPKAYLHEIARQVRYAGYHESAYLAPSVFTPDDTVRQSLGLGEQEPFVIVRLVGWQASHDWKRKRLATDQRVALIERLREVARVYISVEGDLPEVLQPWKFPLELSQMHHAMAEATAVVGESSTMCSEAAVLGVPSVFIHPRIQRGYTQDQADRWGIVHWYSPSEFDAATDKSLEIIAESNPERWQSIGDAIAAESIDVTEFICDQIELVGRPSRQAPRRIV